MPKHLHLDGVDKPWWLLDGENVDDLRKYMSDACADGRAHNVTVRLADSVTVTRAVNPRALRWWSVVESDATSSV